MLPDNNSHLSALSLVTNSTSELFLFIFLILWIYSWLEHLPCACQTYFTVRKTDQMYDFANNKKMEQAVLFPPTSNLLCSLPSPALIKLHCYNTFSPPPKKKVERPSANRSWILCSACHAGAEIGTFSNRCRSQPCLSLLFYNGGEKKTSDNKKKKRKSNNSRKWQSDIKRALAWRQSVGSKRVAWGVDGEI